MTRHSGTIALLANRHELARGLIAWFRRSARDLPWRRTRDLYAIWISEVMLQQTQVATVIPYWERFLSRFPTAASLACASEHEVLQHWEGLGYYRRARQLHAAAKQVEALHAGQFPITFADVRALPGIGRYTAGAILSIGLDQPLPILEANTVRVYSRLAAYRGDVQSTAGQQHLWKIAEALLPDQHCGAFNQSLMELGSQICTPKTPACEACPVAELCGARQQGAVKGIPRPPRRTEFESVTEAAVVVRHRNRLLLRQCQPGERWAGLWDFLRFPVDGDRASENSDATIIIREQVRRLAQTDVVVRSHFATIKHGVTRFRITLDCWEATLVAKHRSPKGQTHAAPMRWLTLAELSGYPLSMTARKISRLLANSPL